MPPSRSLPRWLAIAVLVLLGLVVAASSLLAAKWPFTRESIAKRLGHNGTFQVAIGSFHSTYFPPGCIAENVVFRNPKGAPLMNIQRLTIQADYPGLLAHPAHLEQMIAEGARATLPQEGLQQNTTAEKDSVIIDELLVRNSVLELTRQRGGYTLVIHQLQLRNVGSRGKIPFSMAAHLPGPDAEVQITGSLGPAPGPASAQNLRQRPFAGSYQLQGELGVFKSIAGKISSRGEFHGTLAALDVSGTTESPNFAVKQSSHSMPLNTRFRGVVDLQTGEVRIPELRARLGSTDLAATAAITPHARTVQLNVNSGHGEIQDLLDLFSRAPRPPMTGPVVFQTRITLPAQPRPFKQRVLLVGDFKIDPAHFTSGSTQLNVDQLSARARGEKKEAGNKKDQAKQSGPESADPDPVLSDLHGHVEMKDGVAHFSKLSFNVPGATANMAGTYNLVNKKVDLHGTMSMQATVSHATSGVKSFFMKVLDPFFKKKNAGAVIPVAMTGTYGHSHFAAGPGK